MRSNTAKRLLRSARKLLGKTDLMPAIWTRVYQIVLALLLVFVGYSVAVTLRKWIQNMATARKQNEGDDVNDARRNKTIYLVLGQVVYVVTIVVTIIIALGLFGLETTSLAAVVGACSLAIGLALQGAMSDVAAGVILTATQPFYVGEYIDIGAVKGRVIDYNLLYTDLEEWDRKTLVRVQNGRFLKDPFENHSRHPYRRVDVYVQIANGVNVKKGQVERSIAVMRKVLEEHPRVLKTHPIYKMRVNVQDMDDHGTLLRAVAPIKTTEFPSIMYDLKTLIRVALEREGVVLSDNANYIVDS